jgi:hypothetical protein
MRRVRAAPSADALRWYAAHSALTDPGPYASMFESLPRGVGASVRVVQGLVIQPRPDDRDPWTDEAHLRFVADMLAHLAERDGRPLVVAREPAERLRANCRNSAVLLVALLRHQGVPARKRAGFARYIADGDAIIHEVAEFWDVGSGRWVLVDADVPLARQRAYLAGHGLPEPADYGVVDLRTADGFVTGGDAWRRCRSGAANPNEFWGAGRGPGMAGVRQALLQDLDGLNRVELCSHDWWGGDLDEKPDDALTAAELALLDCAADVTLSIAADLTELRTFYESLGRDRAIQARLAQLDA